MSCDECEGLMMHRTKDPKCEQCMPIQLLPGNEQAVDIFFLIKQFGNLSFESIDRAMLRLGVDDENIFNKIAIFNQEFTSVKTQIRKNKQAVNGSKRR